MGFLEKKKLPEQEKKFLFRNEYLASLKYAINNFCKSNPCYYPNFFFIEGDEGSGKTWLLNQVTVFSKERAIAPNVLDVRFDAKKIILSEVLGIVNFMVQLRNAIVERDPSLEKVFSRFDEGYKNFLQGTLTDDTGKHDDRPQENSMFEMENEPVKQAEMIQEKEESNLKTLRQREANRKSLQQEKEANSTKTNTQASDAKSRLASMRSKGMPTKKAEVTTIKNTGKNSSLIPGHLQKEPASKTQALQQVPPPVPPSQPHAVNKKPQANLSMTATAYTPLNTFTDKELPRLRNGEADIKAIAKNLTSAVESLKRGNVKTVDYKSILFKKFLQAFDAISANRKLVLMIDSFEKIQPIYNFFFNGFLKNLRTEIILIIASQIDMERELKEKYDTNLFYMYMQNFSYFEIEEFLRKGNIISEGSIIDSILELTGGSPAGISLIGGAFQNFKNDVFRIMQFLGNPEEDYKNLRYVNVITLDYLPQHDKKIIILLAMIRRIDFGLIENIAGVFNAENLLTSLSEKYPFVEVAGLSELFKRYTRTYAKHEMPSLYEEINRRAFDYYSDKVELDPSDKENLIDAFYYHFRVNEETAYTSLLSVVSYYISHDINFCEEIIHGIATVGLSKEMRNRLNLLKDSFPYVILRDYKKTLPLLEAISELQRLNNPSMQLLDGF